MINVDIKTFFQDRIWFGWWYRGEKGADDSILNGYFWGWVRDPDPKYHRVIKDRFSDKVFDDA